MELSEIYEYGKDVITWALIPLGFFIWNLRGKVDKLMTKDEADSKFVKSEELKRTIKECFSEFAKDSLELDSKYVTTHHLAYREREMVKEITKSFTDETRRLETFIAQSNVPLATLPEKVTDLDKTMMTLDLTLKGLKSSLDFVANQLDETGDIMDQNKQELSDKIHAIELNCARRNHA